VTTRWQFTSGGSRLEDEDITFRVWWHCRLAVIAVHDSINNVRETADEPMPARR
jgi:hypothetical protein